MYYILIISFKLVNKLAPKMKQQLLLRISMSST